MLARHRQHLYVLPDTVTLDAFQPLNTFEDMTAFEVKLTTDTDLKLTLVSNNYYPVLTKKDCS